MSLIVSLPICCIVIILTLSAFQSRVEGKWISFLHRLGVLISSNYIIQFLILELNLALISWVLFAFQVENPLALPFQDPVGITLRFFILWSILVFVVVMARWRNENKEQVST
jgi:hypothetical protein